MYARGYGYGPGGSLVKNRWNRDGYAKNVLAGTCSFSKKIQKDQSAIDRPTVGPPIFELRVIRNEVLYFSKKKKKNRKPDEYGGIVANTAIEKTDCSAGHTLELVSITISVAFESISATTRSLFVRFPVDVSVEPFSSPHDLRAESL